MGDAVLHTPRLLLRPFRLGDASFMVELNADPEVVRFTGDAAFGSEDEALVVVQSLVIQWSARGLGRLLVLDRETSAPVGWCELKWHDDEQAVDLGFRFQRSVWGLGYATEASQACLVDADRRGLRVFARAVPENVASVRVLEKLGFTTAAAPDAEGFLRFERPQRPERRRR